MNFRIALLSCALAAFTASGCCTDPVNGEQYLCLVSVSEEQEIQMGQQYAPDFTAQSGGAYPDPQLQAYLSDIVIGMAKKSERPTLPWNFTILNTSQINAFALPGGEVFVTRGLLSELESEAQFAQLMGHEIGHVTHRHGVRGQNRAALLQVLVGAAAMADQHLLDPDTPLLSGATGVIGNLTMMHYSREQELQSDSRGIDYAIAAGYDPRESTKTFQMFLEMKQASGHTGGLVEELLASHPPDERRIDEITSYIAEKYPDTPVDKLAVSKPAWGTHLARVRQAQESYVKLDEAIALIDKARTESQQSYLDDAEVLVRAGASRLPGHAPFPATLGLIALERRDDNEATLQLNRACQLDQDYFQARYYRGLLHLRRKAYTEAQRDMAAAHTLFPSNPVPCYHLGAIAENEGNQPGAIEHYSNALARSSQESTVHQRAAERLQALQGSDSTTDQATL